MQRSQNLGMFCRSKTTTYQYQAKSNIPPLDEIFFKENFFVMFVTFPIKSKFYPFQEKLTDFCNKDEC